MPEVHQDFGVVEVGPKRTEECLEGWDTVPLPSPAPAFDTMGMGELLDAWPSLASFSSTESDREERDFAAAAEFSQALGAMMMPTAMPSTVMSPGSMTPAAAVVTPTFMTPTVMTPANITAAVMTPDSSTPASLTPAPTNPTRFGCRTRPTAFVFDARTEKARSAAASTTVSTGKPPLGYDGNGGYNDGDGGAGGRGALGTTPPGKALPFDGTFLEKRADSGDIEGGNSNDSVATVAETYLLAGPDEETYRGYEDAVAADTFLETTLAMLPQQTARQQQETFIFGTGL